MSEIKPAGRYIEAYPKDDGSVGIEVCSGNERYLHDLKGHVAAQAFLDKLNITPDDYVYAPNLTVPSFKKTVA